MTVSSLIGRGRSPLQTQGSAGALSCEPAAGRHRAGSVPCFTATGRDGVLIPVNKQKRRAEGGER